MKTFIMMINVTFLVIGAYAYGKYDPMSSSVDRAVMLALMED